MERKVKVKIDRSAKITKYFLEKQKGKNKGEAAVIAGYSPRTPTSQIEKSPQLAVVEEYYRNKLLNTISLEEIAIAHADNIRQEEDKGARNTAIKMALDKIEPEVPQENDDDRVLIVMRG